MSHFLLQDPRFFRLLLRIDQELAQHTHAAGCACGSVLHRGDYPRKPRGCLREVQSEFESRFSFCCSVCRKRTTSMSVRFLGRRVYLAMAVVLMSARHAGQTSAGARASALLDVPVRTLGCKAGLVLNPATPVGWLDHVMDKLDIVLLMSVNPGFGGQTFIPSTLGKLRVVRRRIDAHRERGGQPIWLEVDGGVKTDNIAQIVHAGADTCVAGSAVFCAPDADGGYHSVMLELRRQAAAR